MNIESLMLTAVKASIIAGKAVMHHYNTNYQVEYKKDNSPLTSADNASHQQILSVLSYSGIPILSEEGKDIPYCVRKDWQYFWLVDPLDGTKEFINHNGEFTVNIALIKHGKPIMGVIYVPVHRLLYFGNIESGAYRVVIDYNDDFIDNEISTLKNRSQKLPIITDRPVTILGSRSHQTPENTDFISKFSANFESLNLVNAGSSLKFCRVAEGAADIYPRLGPTMEWDTAAGHAICKAATAKVLQFGYNEEIVYNKENLLNPWFVVVTPEFERYI